MISSQWSSTLNNSFPGRSNQIEQLLNIFAKDEPVYPECIFLHGGPSTGKTTLISSVLSLQTIDFVLVDLHECYTPKILFETIIKKLKLQENTKVRCDNTMDFVMELQKLQDKSCSTVIVLDNCENLKSMDSLLVSFFFRLKELSGCNVTVVFIAERIYEKFYTNNQIMPIKVLFNQYNKNELLNILMLSFEEAKKHFNEITEEFYLNYLNVCLSMFYRVCRDLSELRRLAKKIFPEYIEPIVNKQCSMDNSMFLWRNISPVLKANLDVVYLRISGQLTHKKSQSLGTSDHSFELPFYAKYLLIASYLASYNPLKDDKKLFVKYRDRKKTTRKTALKSTVTEQLNVQLGPKAFSLDRVLAIFYSIIDDKVGFNNNLLVQVSSLVQLQLLSLVSDKCLLEGQKYKCNVNIDFIQKVSKMVGFNIRKYLTDFHNM